MNIRKIHIIIILVISVIGCMQSTNSSQSEEEKKISTDFLDKGKIIAQETQKVLGENLMQAISQRGTEHALSFCNLKAIPLTDSMNKELKSHIKRVSDKPRNPDNQASKAELAFIQKKKEELTAGKECSPKMIEVNGQMVGYYPIITNGMCMQCHGSSSEINEETIAKIDSLYPEDKARGYSPNQVRGLWVITMDK